MAWGYTSQAHQCGQGSSSLTGQVPHDRTSNSSRSHHHLGFLCQPNHDFITPQGWYGSDAGLTGFQFFVALFFHAETNHDRDIAGYQEAVSDDNATASVDHEAEDPMKLNVTVCMKKLAGICQLSTSDVEVRHAAVDE